MTGYAFSDMPCELVRWLQSGERERAHDLFDAHLPLMRHEQQSDVLKGIHLSMASRIVKLLKVTGIRQGTALITGGLALDSGLLAAIQEEMVNEKLNVSAVAHADSIYAGAIGAALWGAFRHEKLARMQDSAVA